MSCPFCLEDVKDGALACPHCARTLPAGRKIQRRRLALIVGGVLGLVVLGFVGSAVVAGIAESLDNRARCERAWRIFHRYSAEDCIELVHLRGKAAAFRQVEMN